MKSILTALAIATSLVCTEVAFAETKTQGQVLVKGFFTENLGDGVDQFHMETGVVTTDGYLALTGYHGLQLRIREKDSLHLLAGEYFDVGGLSGILSVWYTLPLDEKNSLRVVVDYWHPLSGKRTQQFYAYSSWDHQLNEKLSLGFATEHIVDVSGAWQEAAIGPTFGLGKMYLWVNYDFRPAQPDRKIMARVIHIFR